MSVLDKDLVRTEDRGYKKYAFFFLDGSGLARVIPLVNETFISSVRKTSAMKE